MKYSIKNFFSKCHQIRSFLGIWSHLLKKYLMEKLHFLCSGWWWYKLWQRDGSALQINWLVSLLWETLVVNGLNAFIEIVVKVLADPCVSTVAASPSKRLKLYSHVWELEAGHFLDCRKCESSNVTYVFAGISTRYSCEFPWSGFYHVRVVVNYEASSSQHWLVQSQQWKHQNNLWNL